MAEARVQGGEGNDRRRRGPRRLAYGLLALPFTLSLSLSLSLAPAARADVLLLPAERAGRTADITEVADVALSTGTSLHSHEAARAALVEVYGEDAPSLSGSDLSRWTSSSRQAVQSLARADYDGARAALAQAEALTDRALAELNREEERARQVLDTCLYLVRSLEETNQHGRAVEQGYACRRLVPRGEPTTNQHPPEVMAILAEVDRALARMPGVRLRVRSEPEGCVVRLNGLDLGVTPLSSDDVRPGEYRVQVECDGVRGRVHRLTLAGAGTELRVDAQAEALLGTDPLRVRLGESDGRALTPIEITRLVRLGRVARVDELWVVSESGSARRRVYSLHRVSVAEGRELAVVHTGERSLPLALASLRQGRSHDWTTDQEVEGEARAPETSSVDATATSARASDEDASWYGARSLASEASAAPIEPPPPSEPPPAPVSARAPSASDHAVERVIGTAAIILGVGAYGASWGLFGYRIDRGQALASTAPSDPQYLSRLGEWLDAEPLMIAPAFTGAALWTLAVPLVFGPDEGVPAWSWVLGGVGLVGAGTGITVAALAERCSTSVAIDSACVNADSDWGAGVLVLAQALPLVAFPITHLIRSALGTDDVAVSADTAVEGEQLSFRVTMLGSF